MGRTGRENKRRYGYRRITIDLKDMGYSINHKIILRLMNELGLKTKLTPLEKRSQYAN